MDDSKHVKPLPIGPGQESVWDYPRPPRLEKTSRHIQVVYRGILIADTHEALRVLETSHPPTYYIPPGDYFMAALHPSNQSSFCEWKGIAVYYNVVVGMNETLNAAWYYPNPAKPYMALKDHVAFYPQLMDACTVDGERVQPQPGGFYGGWITSDIIGPFKGEPGSADW
jgi:uncharacterized protein (DUF427 family)